MDFIFLMRLSIFETLLCVNQVRSPHIVCLFVEVWRVINVHNMDFVRRHIITTTYNIEKFMIILKPFRQNAGLRRSHILLDLNHHGC